MNLLTFGIACAVAHCALPAGWAVKTGDPAPDLVLRDRSGTEVRLSQYRRRMDVALLAQAPGPALSPAVLDDTCRQLAALNTAVLFLAGDAEANRQFLDHATSATLLIDSAGVIRRVLPGRVLTGSDLAGFVRLWQSGKTVYQAACSRCHGDDGDLNLCEDVKPLAGIGKRLTEAEIRARLRIGNLNDREVLIRGQIFKRPEVDAVVVYVAGL